MKRIWGLGSLNKAKIRAATSVLSTEGISINPLSVDTSVCDQPFSDEETLKGAIARAENCLSDDAVEAGIGLEAGVTEMSGRWYVCNWGALATQDGNLFKASGAKIPLPDRVAHAVVQGKELGVVMEKYVGTKRVREREGAIGIFTAGYVDRTTLFSHLIRLLYGQWRFQSFKNGIDDTLA